LCINKEVPGETCFADAMFPNGIMILDKPADISSAQAVSRVKRLLGVKKIGHTGTLDPFATGVLICCINQATRLARFFLHADKTYQAVLRLGVETDTQDATGRVIAQTTVPSIASDRLIATIKGFEGRQLQRPPVYAALKHEGTPLYKLARQGRPVQKPARPIQVTALTVTWIDLPDIGLELTCSSGTYVRALCADIGSAMGCGGHLARLRRTASSGFGIEQAITLNALQEMESGSRLANTLIPMNAALSHMPMFMADSNLLERIAHGQRLRIEDLPTDLLQIARKPGLADHVKVVDADLELKAVLTANAAGTAYDYCCVFH
jgi:tRNA pseudouridine55 synthase